jgi:glycosyltransferase involved in cell wall biosynthesis
MKVLYIHTYYIHRGGEDIVYESEKSLMKESGWEVESVLFNNSRYAVIKFMLLFFNPFSFIRVWRAIDRFRPDAVHVHNWYFGASPAVFLAARIKRIPLLHTIHNFRIICPSGVLFNDKKLFTHSISRIFPVLSIRKKVYKNSMFFTFWLLTCTRINHLLGTWKSIDRFICLTNSSKEILCNSILKVDRDRVFVKPNFVRHDIQPAPFERSDHFLYVGRLSEEKGIETLLSAFSESKYSLRIIGDGPLKSVVTKFVADADNAFYLGFQKKDFIIQEMSRCSALIVPSLCYEQFGLIIIEALSCGTPVIASDIGAPADLVCEGTTGLHFTAGSPSDLSEKLDKWHSIPEIDKQVYYRNAVKSYCNQFTANKNLDQLTSIYKSTIYEKAYNFQFPGKRGEISGLS